MTVLKISIEDEQEVELVKRLLQDVLSVKIEEETEVTTSPAVKNESAVERIKKILENAKGQELFKEIEDPSEWQRQIRKEWDRDF